MLFILFNRVFRADLFLYVANQRGKIYPERAADFYSQWEAVYGAQKNGENIAVPVSLSYDDLYGGILSVETDYVGERLKYVWNNDRKRNRNALFFRFPINGIHAGFFAFTERSISV